MPRRIAGAAALPALLVMLVAPGDAAAAAPVTGQGLTGVVDQVQTVAAGAGATVDQVGSSVGQVAPGTVQRTTDRALGSGTDAVDQVAPGVDVPTGGGPTAETIAEPGAPTPQDAAPPPSATRPATLAPVPRAGRSPARTRHRASGTATEAVPATTDVSTALPRTTRPSGPTAAPQDRAGAAGPDGSPFGRSSFAAGGAAGSPAAGFSGTGVAILLAALFLAASALSTPLRLSRVGSAPAPLVFALERPG
jgi:hypothetical protein